MGLTGSGLRAESYGQSQKLSPVDHLGVWLSSRQVRRHVPDFRGRRVADLGCGYHATFARTLLERVEHLTLLDVALEPALAEHPRVTAIAGGMPEALAGIPDGSLDVALCNSVLEHLWEPVAALREFHRMLAPNGIALVNVPSWRGKRWLELSAFRLGLSPADEMNDHKMYYDPRDLWPLLVRAGFRPQDIRCFGHKLGLNTFAVCRRRPEAQQAG
jgi:SAM-dependent methyltransferase